jgi:hypothetical protein
MLKFLLNLLVQSSKVCQKSKFQIKFERILFLELWPISDFRPSCDLPPSFPLLAQPTPPLPLTDRRACPISRLPFIFPRKPDHAPPPPPLACAAATRASPSHPKWPPLHPSSLPTHPLCFPSPTKLDGH